jgi:hypothetical protein
MVGVTFDTGALIAIESRRVGIAKLVRDAQKGALLVPANAVAEWWRGDRDQTKILSAFTIVDVTEIVSKLAGAALEWLHGRNAARRIDSRMTIDATVMATASLHGTVLYTGDHDDMDRFTPFFPNVKLMGRLRRRRGEGSRSRRARAG